MKKEDESKLHEFQIMENIIELCVQINQKAAIVYDSFASTCDDEKTKIFWNRMSNETNSRLKYWEQLKSLSKDNLIPILFQEPLEVELELKKNILSIDDILNADLTKVETKDKYLQAFRLEFFMLHRAFATFCIFSKNISLEENTPSDDYEKHLDYFIDTLRQHEELSSELELVAQTIRRLWEDIRTLTIINTIDNMTGVRNKSGFFQSVMPMAHLAHRKGNIVGFIFIDIDNFKNVNDLHGHLEGDRVLESVARNVKSSIRKHDIVGRYGGDEIVVFLPDVDRGLTRTIAERICRNIENGSSKTIPVTASVGFYENIVKEDVEESIQEYIKKADSFLYEAKNSGKNRVVGNP